MENTGGIAASICQIMRVHTMSEINFFHVTDLPVPFEKLDAILDPLLERLYAAKKAANLGESGPDITRYYKLESGLWVMEVGIPVKDEVKPAAPAMIKRLAPFPCAGVLLWGSLTHVVEAYTALGNKMKEEGVEPTDESREWMYWFEGVDSEQNLMGIFRGIRPAASVSKPNGPVAG